MKPFAEPEQMMEHILSELRATDAELAIATREKSTFLETHRHLVRTEIANGCLVTPVNRMRMHVEVETLRKEFAVLESRRNWLVERRNAVLQVAEKIACLRTEWNVGHLRGHARSRRKARRSI